MALGQNQYQMRWPEFKTATALNLEVLWGWDGSTADLPGHGLGMDQDDVWSLYMITRLDDFNEKVYVLRLLLVRQEET